MRVFLNGLWLGILVGGFGLWFAQQKLPSVRHRDSNAVSSAITNAIRTAATMSDAVHARQDALGLRPEQIRAELKKKGEVVRRKSQDIDDQSVNDASDGRAVTDIKAKFGLEPTLSQPTNMVVHCTHGHVTLAGTVTSLDDIGKALAIALGEDGVRDATSTLEVKPKE